LAVLLGACSSSPVSSTEYRKSSARTGRWKLIIISTFDQPESAIAVSPDGVQTHVRAPITDKAENLHIWQIRQPNTGQAFVVTYAPPSASAPNVMRVYRVANGRLVLDQELPQHYEIEEVAGTQDDQMVSVVDLGDVKLSRLIFPDKLDSAALSIIATFVEPRSPKPDVP
jgi:hypothetical protein